MEKNNNVIKVFIPTVVTVEYGWDLFMKCIIGVVIITIIGAKLIQTIKYSTQPPHNHAHISIIIANKISEINHEECI